MTYYSIETLLEINESYHFQHQLTPSDVEKANKWVEFIENTRVETSPQVGDIVRFTDKFGNYYENAHIENMKDGKLQICQKPYVPFVDKDRYNKLLTNTSGGAWSSIPVSIQYVGKQEKMFHDWGHPGRVANGTVQFLAMVNVWEYAEAELDYTTKTHDKFYVTIVDEIDADYKYLIYKDMMNYCAFKTDDEYQAWLKTFKGVEHDAALPTGKTVWTYKQINKYVTIDEYHSLDGLMVDSELNNGSIQECKREFNKTSIITYMPFQHDKIILINKKRFMNAY